MTLGIEMDEEGQEIGMAKQHNEFCKWLFILTSGSSLSINIYPN